MLDESHISLQRARGRGRLHFGCKEDRTVLRDLHQSGCLKLMLPRNHHPVPDAVMINTAGGLTGGDRLDLDIGLDAGAKLRVATQTAERIYKSTGDTAHVKLRFDLDAQAALDWLAQETILFDGGRVDRSIEVDMDASASLLLVEPIVLGRLAMGETVHSGLLHDHWRVKRAGKLCFADETRLADFDALRAPASLGKARAMATVLFVDPMAEALAARLRDVAPHADVTTGISAWNGQLVIRTLSANPPALRAALMKFVELIRGRDLPRVWTM